MIYPKLPLCGTKKAHRSTVMQRQPTYAPKRIRLMGYGRVWIRISACGIRIGWYIMRLRSITICISFPFCLRNGFSVRRLSLRLITPSIPYTEPFVNKSLKKDRNSVMHKCYLGNITKSSAYRTKYDHALPVISHFYPRSPCHASWKSASCPARERSGYNNRGSLCSPYAR